MLKYDSKKQDAIAAVFVVEGEICYRSCLVDFGDAVIIARSFSFMQAVRMSLHRLRRVLGECGRSVL